MTEWHDGDPFALSEGEVSEGEGSEGEGRGEEGGEVFAYEKGLQWEEEAKVYLRSIVGKREGLWMLRVVVEGGGCSGYRVSFELDDKRREEDVVFGEEDARVVIDSMGLRLVDGARVRRHEGLGGSYFFLDIPQAVSGCGCGESFSL